MATLLAVEQTNGPIEPTLADLRDLLARTHEQIRSARRHAHSLPGASVLAIHLQTLESELVRAKVALNELETSSATIIPFDPVALTDRS